MDVQVSTVIKKRIKKRLKVFIVMPIGVLGIVMSWKVLNYAEYRNIIL
jgi:hypothetical protein